VAGASATTVLSSVTVTSLGALGLSAMHTLPEAPGPRPPDTRTLLATLGEW
jgi:hypothetical protein